MADLQTIQISQDILDSARLTIPEVQQELAIWLYAQGCLGIGKARELAGLSLWEFHQLLASRKISPHYDIQELNEDVDTLHNMGSI